MWADFLFAWEGGEKDVARPQTFPAGKGAVGG